MAETATNNLGKSSRAACLLGACALGGLVASAVAEAGELQLLNQQVGPVFEKYCVQCHGPEQAEAELDLTQLLGDPAAFHAVDKVLLDVYDVVDFEEMPPRKAEAQPNSREREIMTQWAEATLTHIEESQKNDPGLVVMPRVTRGEYDRVIRDLTGAEIAASNLLPTEGGAGEGFANVGEAHSISLTQIEKYLAASKFVLRHLIATPEGWFWATIPLPKTSDDDSVRDNLLSQLKQWYVDNESAVVSSSNNKLNKDFENPQDAYLEAVWKYVHRDRIGMPNASLQEVGKTVSSALVPVSLEKWNAILAGDLSEQPPFLKYQVERWRSLPAPGEISEEEARETFASIIDHWQTPSRKFWQMNDAPKFELNFREGDRRDQTQEDAKKGFWPFEIDTGNLDEVYLVTTPAGMPGQEARVRWEEGVFELKDGSEVPWTEALAGAEQIRGDFNVSADSFETIAPSTLRVKVPDGAERLRVTARIDEDRLADTVVQTIILAKQPSDTEQIFYAKRRPIGQTGTDFFEAWMDGMWQTRNIARGSNDFSKKEAPIAGVLDDRTIEALGLDPRQVAHDDERAHQPGYLTAAELRESVNPAERQKLETLHRLLQATAQPAGEHQLQARKQLVDFMTRAWRRPVTEAEVEELLQLYREGRVNGMAYDPSLKLALSASMMSPYFVYRHPVQPGEQIGAATRPLTDLELASRLSFSIWASIPDEELIQVALDGRLSNPDELKAQARRMLQDPRAAALGEEFAAQWFRFDNFDRFEEPDSEMFPEWKPEIARAMYEEMRMFFVDLVQNNRPITNVLDADYTFLNGALVEHYGIEGVEGSHMRPVALNNPGRGGVLGMGAMLTKTSAPLRTSPVKRGVWVIEELLGEELPTPPADVEPLSDTERNDEGLTIPEQLAVHRDNPSCSGCHQKFDPLGIALENFDPIGRWREKDTAGDPLATTDTMPDGTELTGFSALREYLVANRSHFVHHFCRKLLGYMLGRGVQAGDRELLSRMEKALAENDYRFLSALDAILESEQFLNRRVETEEETTLAAAETSGENQ